MDPGKSIDKKRKIAENLAAQGRGLHSGSLQGTGPLNRDGRPRLPVGQHEVENWPDEWSKEVAPGELERFLAELPHLGSALPFTAHAKG